MIQDFSQREDFTIEVETTPACNLACPWCENRKSKPFESFAGENVCFEHLLAYASFVQRKLPSGKPVRIVLNGGEPTLHPRLLDFCQAASRSGFKVELLTNLTASVELYREAMSAGCAIVPTFHLGYTQVDFAEKLAQLRLKSARAFVASAEQLASVQAALPGRSTEAVVPEGSKLSREAASRLAAVSASARSQLQLKAKLEDRAKKPRICYSCEKYVYANGDGTVQTCMFLPRSHQLCRMSDIDSYHMPTPVPCSNPWCFYSFGEER